MAKTLLVEKTATRWTFRLNRPEKRNALSAGMVEALITELQAAEAAAIPLWVFVGEGKNFSAGFDFTEYETCSEADLALRFIRIEEMLQRIACSRALTIGLAHGRNFGAGVDLFAACKLRACAPDATFRMPGLLFGLVLGTRRLRHLIGATQAQRVLNNAETFGAEPALNMGFVQSVQDSAQWPALLDQAEKTATLLDSDTRQTLYAMLYPQGEADSDLAALVRSATRPGLKSRIKAYLA
ncbi:enoyl-CoA hydratase/isomerase family protein [Bordetella sp. 15P40C-2]|uniref:enoyl-CoA hydratase/isomerase family protein n=1 Tax=Bordetella sp. 15P40C-2 TaxID=2572246 RepID=UPI0013243A5A|nr:enoyl-CoA hydratase/isomerase family protein [Bordetella sp. 15P40C-2]MVW72725.1 enoyl-CoA hydratase/isomerase family protein [Bordetella sp. 15P40C-2]